MRGLLLGLALGVGAMIVVMTWRERGSAAEIASWKEKFDAAKATVRTDSVEVVKWVSRTKTLSDTINIHDTLQVIEYIQRTDTLRQRCMACIASASRLAVTADTVFIKLEANARKWTDRFGLHAGYGATLVDGRIRTGPTFSASVRVWPWR